MRTELDPEDQKVIIRWRLAVAGVYATVAIITVIVAALTSSEHPGITEAPAKATIASVSTNAKH